MSFAQRISDEKYSSMREYKRSYKNKSIELLATNVPEGRVLDIGCGTGVNSEKIAEYGIEVCGIDISPVAIEQYRSLQFEGKVGDITSGTCYEPESFDGIYASEVVEHVADTEAMLKNCHTILKPGGFIVLTTPNSSFWAYRVLALFGRTLSESQHPGHIRFFSLNSLTTALKQAGFEGVDAQARNMYFILPGGFGESLLQRLGFTKEYRFAKKSNFLHLSSIVNRASSFWSDTFIIVARKANAQK